MQVGYSVYSVLGKQVFWIRHSFELQGIAAWVFEEHGPLQRQQHDMSAQVIISADEGMLQQTGVTHIRQNSPRPVHTLALALHAKWDRPAIPAADPNR